MNVRDGPGGQVCPYNTTKSLQRLLLECSACTKITVQTFQEIVDHMHVLCMPIFHKNYNL
jgi:hypothetical protein